MQGTKIRLLAGSLLMLASAGYVQADALQPDPAWQQGTLANGLQWQVLATPQRPSDRIEVRLQVNTGSLTESTQQSGFSHAIPRIALTQSGGLDAAQARSLWQQGFDPKRPMPPVIVSYDSTLYNLSLPNNRNDLLKEALTYLANVSGKLTITPETVNHALSSEDMVATWPADTKEGWWRYRLKGSALLGHDPAEPLKQPVDAAKIQAFYEKWYTPDAMTLIVVGNIDARSVAEQINKTFGTLKGKRETPAPVPTLSPLRAESVSIMTDAVRGIVSPVCGIRRGNRFANRRRCCATGRRIWRVKRCSGISSKSLLKITRKILAWGLTAGFCSCARSAPSTLNHLMISSIPI